MLVGKRTNVEFTTEALGSDDDVQALAASKGKLFRPNAIDYFLYSRGAEDWPHIPDFVVGRRVYDNWLVDHAFRDPKVDLIDTSSTVLALHLTAKDGNQAGHHKGADNDWNVKVLNPATGRPVLHDLTRRQVLNGNTDKCPLFTRRHGAAIAVQMRAHIAGSLGRSLPREVYSLREHAVAPPAPAPDTADGAVAGAKSAAASRLPQLPPVEPSPPPPPADSLPPPTLVEAPDPLTDSNRGRIDARNEDSKRKRKRTNEETGQSSTATPQNAKALNSKPQIEQASGIKIVCVTTRHDLMRLSLFQGGRLERFGSGRFRYKMGNCEDATLRVGGLWWPPSSLDADVVIGGSERCHTHGGRRRPDFTQYWSKSRDGDEWNRTVGGAANTSMPAFFPLGARFEFKHVTLPEIRRASQRELLFNFVGALGTSISRKKMIASIESLNTSSANAALLARGFLHTATQHYQHVNSRHAEKHGYLNADEYRGVLLKSALTLVPAGVNPECFRLWEALEAGSIPVVPLGEAYHQHPCKDALLPLRQSSAPVIFVRDWTELPRILKDVIDHPARADKMQQESLAWYDRFMRDTAARFEAVLDARLALKQGATAGAAPIL